MVKLRRRKWFWIILILILGGLVFQKTWQWTYTVSPAFHLEGVNAFSGVAIVDGRVATYDGDILTFYTAKGREVGRVDRTGEGQEAFFGEKHAILFDRDLSKISVFDSWGKEVADYPIQGELFSALERDGELIFEVRQGDSEILYSTRPGGNLQIIFETRDYLLDYAQSKGGSWLAATLSNEAGGYKTSIYEDNETGQREDFPMEVAMELAFIGRDGYMATEKNLRKLGKENLRREIPLFTDMEVTSEGIHLLHSGLLTHYNKNLEETKEVVLSGNVTQLKEMNGTLFAYGQRDLVGNPYGPRTFTVHLKGRYPQWAMEDGILATVTENHLYVYTMKTSFSAPEVQDVAFEEENNEG
ncbi:MAG: hypothetical protein Q4E76_03430 [Tissierellia bacterium]|nr:hypothetical protein [Tissierellia bacterium]